MAPTRRHLLKTGALALAGSPFLTKTLMAARNNQTPLFTAMGIAASLGKAVELKTAGAEFLTESTGDFLVPDKDEATFASNLEKLAASPLPVLACNGFIRPAELRSVGPDAAHDAVVAWADIVFRRLAKAKGRFIVFGSAGSRRLPDGWPRAKAEEQFVALLKRMGPLAANHGITVVVEQLQPSECNFITRITEAATLIRRANHPNIRVLADLFHMMRSGDTPEDLKSAMDTVVHVEIAEKANRTVPGVAGDDFRPLFGVLKAASYQGAINIEGKGSVQETTKAFTIIRQQALESLN